MTLTDLINRQTEKVQALAELLERERSALVGRDAAALEGLAADKLARLADIERIEHECREWLMAAGFTVDGDGMACAVEQSEDSDLAWRWQMLRSQLGSLRGHNERNGLAIQRSLTLAEEELTLLRGGAIGAETYNAAGRRAEDGRSRSLTRA